MSTLLLFPDAVSIQANRPPDWEAREQALDIGQSWIVEAPAGSGKTGLLIQRYLKLLATVDEPEEVMALTFTNKATAEMRDRVLSALEDAADPAAKEPEGAFADLTRLLAGRVLRQDSARGWRLREQAYRLNIRTIDSFCGELAQESPLLSGGIGRAIPLPDATDLYARAARAVLLRLGGEDVELHNAIRTVLLHRDADLSECERLLAEMLATREQWGELIPLSQKVLSDDLLDGEVLPKLNEALGSAVCAALSELHARFPEQALEELAEIACELAHAEGHGGAPNIFYPCANAHSAPGTTAADVDHWLLFARLLLTEKGWRKSFSSNHLSVKADKFVKERLVRLVQELSGDEELFALLDALRSLPPTVYPAEQWIVAKALFRLLGHALAELRLLFAREEVCDFPERALLARAALRRAKEAGTSQETGASQLRHLLVDEMQDTSSSQYELLESITAGWDGKTKTLFLVGDPKQSIYLFRQARVERFLGGMKTGKLGGMSLGRLQLLANFRSGARLVSEFNAVFAKVFPRTQPKAGDVSYTSAVPVEAVAENEDWAWHASALPYEPDPARSTDARRGMGREVAEQIASLIHDWRETPLPKGRIRLWQIAVLTRARTHVAAVIKALTEAAIPFRAVEIERLAERPEVLDAVALTRALLHPADRTAWLAVLHAPWCGLGLGDLHVLAAGDQGDLREQALHGQLRVRANGLTHGSKASLLRTLDVLDAAALQRGRSSIAMWVERTWRSLGGDACTSALGRENVSSFFKLLDVMERSGKMIDGRSLADGVEKLFAEPSHAPDAVDVMTIHKAKGLEWDVVLVPGMHKRGGRSRYPLLDWIELPSRSANGTREVLLAPIGSKGAQIASLNRYIQQIRKRREQAEVKRLLYVAATRARTALHMFAAPNAAKDGVIKPIAGTLLCAAWPAVSSLWDEVSVPVPMEQPEDATFAIAASGVEAPAPKRRRPPLERLSLAYDVRNRMHTSKLPTKQQIVEAPRQSAFERPEGSFAARALGNAIHAFAEKIASRVANATIAPERTFDQVLNELPLWSGRVEAFLRGSGLSPEQVRYASGKTLTALTNMVGDADGRWVLSPHREAASESAVAAVFGTTDVGAEQPSTLRVRLDRSFFAGAASGSSGDDVLWIIDLKTADRSDGEVDTFLQRERERYTQQLCTYAEVRRRTLPAETPIMLALYYPLLRRLISWRYEP